MASEEKDLNLALFCDFENVALGVRDAKYARFDIQLVLERVLLKGSINYLVNTHNSSNKNICIVQPIPSKI
jgi:hypothetical protein|tara:strand:- start:457 stop:669 length:213 start_codon:yes stop_codon:yes gene_type:complete